MNKPIFDRQAGHFYREKQFMENELRFLYEKPAGRLLLEACVSRRWFSALYTRRYHTRGSTRLITPFIEAHGINMGNYPLREYCSFNDFFTREMLPGRRPFSENPADLPAPADAKVMALPVSDHLTLRIKQAPYTVASLLQSHRLAARFAGGLCVVLRLTVDDYHRYSFIDNGRLLGTQEIPGRLHTVGPLSNGRCRVMAENHRICSLLKTENFGLVAAVEVGALLVGRIVNHPVKSFIRGQEKGCFAYGGSTILLFFEKGVVTPAPDIAALSKRGIEARVLMGETIGRKTAKTN